MYIILTVITGFCISLMIYFNGSLEVAIGNLPTLLTIHLTALLLSTPMFLIKGKKKLRTNRSRWFLTAGLLGIVIVTVVNRVFIKGGVLLSLSGTLSGQVIVASLMEGFRCYKSKSKFHKGKIISLIFVLTGSLLIGLKFKISFTWILISWIPGMLIFIQSYMNSQNILSVGFRKTLLFHFGTVLIVVIPLCLLFPEPTAITKVLEGDVPLVYLLGGGTLAIFAISIGSYLLLKLNPVTYVLLLFSGQITGALAIDYFSGYPLSLEKVIGLSLIIAGLFIGESKSGKAQPDKLH